MARPADRTISAREQAKAARYLVAAGAAAPAAGDVRQFFIVEPDRRQPPAPPGSSAAAVAASLGFARRFRRAGVVFTADAVHLVRLDMWGRARAPVVTLGAGELGPGVLDVDPGFFETRWGNRNRVTLVLADGSALRLRSQSFRNYQNTVAAVS